MKRKKLIIFGSGDIAQLANYYFESDSEYAVIAFTVDKDYCITDQFEDKPLVPFEDVQLRYNIEEYEMFIAVSYRDMNRLRAEKYLMAKEKGYKIASYISTKTTYLSQFHPGENSFILENVTVQPYVRIGNNVTLWSGSYVLHHSRIDDHNFIGSHVVVSGHCEIQSYCFLGANSTLAHKVILAKGTLLGAGVFISKDTEENGVYAAARPVKLDKTSNQINL